jgi:guanylate kinase
LPQLEADKGNAQVESDAVQLRWQFAHALVAVGADEEAAPVLDKNISALQALMAKNDNIVFVYLLGACEQAMGTLHARRGEAAHADRATRLKEFRAAASLYDQAMTRFKRVTAVATLDRGDTVPIDEAKSGAARVKAELAKLQ